MPIPEALTLTDLAAISDLRHACENGEARRVREAARLSRQELATFLRVSQTTVFRWEDGSRSPIGEAALQYARWFIANRHRLTMRDNVAPMP